MARAPAREVRPARYPYGQEVALKRLLLGLVADLRREALEAVGLYGPAAIQAADEYRPDADGDPIPEGWPAILERLLLAIAQGMVERVARATAQLGLIARRVDAVNKDEFRKQVRNAWGVDIVRGEPWLAGEISAWEQRSLALVKSIPAQTVDRLRGEMADAFRQGASLAQLRKVVMERTGVSRKRAELIAVTSIAQLNSSLTECRHRAAGVTSYRWITSLDERVRPSHRARHGKTFRWDKPPADGHAGRAPRCRCVSQPLFPDLTEALGKRAA